MFARISCVQKTSLISSLNWTTLHACHFWHVHVVEQIRINVGSPKEMSNFSGSAANHAVDFCSKLCELWRLMYACMLTARTQRDVFV